MTKIDKNTHCNTLQPGPVKQGDIITAGEEAVFTSTLELLLPPTP